jgi:membrane protein
VRRTFAILRRTAVAFYDDQMTQHAAALTYYSLMSLFPAALLAISLLGLVGEYPATYNAIIGYLKTVAPDSAVVPLDSSLRTALQHKGTAATTLIISIFLAFYGTTGVLEAARRAMNVIYDVDHGRRFLTRKAIDVVTSVVLMILVLTTLVLIFVGGRFADDLLGYAGIGGNGQKIWSLIRWPLGVAVAMLSFALVYYVTPDVKHHSFRLAFPGAIVAVLLWLAASFAFSTYISRVADVGALYGTFAGAIVLVAWLWLTNVALLSGAELNAEIERQKQLDAGVPHNQTLELQARRG